MTGQVLKDFLRFGRSNLSERIHTFALKLVNIPPHLHVRKVSGNGFRDCWDGSRIFEKPKIKHDVFMTVVSVQAKQFN
ncbi:hypothetical protein CDEF62S_06222 [Castellaniella defragrans]